jgi:cytochrome b561
MNSPQTTILIHWLSALLIIGLLITGIYMTDGNSYPLYYWHKSFGVLALLFVVMRLIYRVQSKWVSAVHGKKEEKLVKKFHLLLLVLTLVMPISGLMMSGFGGYGVPLFELELIAKSVGTDEEISPINKPLASIGTLLHLYIGYTLAVLLVVHIGAAFWHHLVKEDNTLTRMTTLTTNKEN